MLIFSLSDPFALRIDGANSPTATIDWNSQNITGMGNITGTDVDISAGTGTYSSTGQISIVGTGNPLIFAQNTSSGIAVQGIGDSGTGIAGQSSTGMAGSFAREDTGGGASAPVVQITQSSAADTGGLLAAANSSGDVFTVSKTGVVDILQAADPRFWYPAEYSLGLTGYDDQDDEYLRFGVSETGYSKIVFSNHLYMFHTGTPVGYFSSAGFAFPDNKQFQFGSGGDVEKFSHSTNQTNNCLLLGLDSYDTGAMHMVVTSVANTSNYNFAHAKQTNPTVFFHSANQATDEWTSITHDQTDGVIGVGKGVLQVPGLSSVPDEITATSAGVTASITTMNTEVTTNGDSDLDNVTLANGTSGQVKHIYCVVEGNAADTWKITPATMCGGTQITFAGVGEGCTLVYADNEGWTVVANNGGTIT